MTRRLRGPILNRMRTWAAWVALAAVGCGGAYMPGEDGSGGVSGEDASGGTESAGGSEAATGGQETGGEPSTGGSEATGGDESGGAATGGGDASGGAEATGGQSSGGGPATGGAGSGGEVAGVGGTACACTEGPCCDGCEFRPDTFQCADDEVYFAQCQAADAAWCTSYPGRAEIYRDLQDVWCSGESEQCDGEAVHATTVISGCGGTDVCLGEPGDAYCGPCGP